MVSSSSQRDTTRAPQQPDQLASFHSLVDKSVHAAALNRHARAVELSAKAAEKGEALFGDNSLVVANLRIGESSALASLAIEARGAEKQALIRRSWSALLSVIAILQLRLANNTLLPGTVRKEELDYYAHTLAAIGAAKEMPVLPAVKLHALASTLRYNVLLDALHRGLNFLFMVFQPLWPETQQKMVELFVRALLSSLPPALTRVPAGASLFRYSKPWTSSLAQPVCLKLDQKTMFKRSSKKPCPHKISSPLFAQPFSASGDLMR